MAFGQNVQVYLLWDVIFQQKFGVWAIILAPETLESRSSCTCFTSIITYVCTFQITVFKCHMCIPLDLTIPSQRIFIWVLMSLMFYQQTVQPHNHNQKKTIWKRKCYERSLIALRCCPWNWLLSNDARICAYTWNTVSLSDFQNLCSLLLKQGTEDNSRVDL